MERGEPGPAAVTPEALREGFVAAVRNCIYDEHPAGCSFGGFSLYSLYWMAAEGCTLPHDDVCAWCPAEATTGFVGWEEGHDGEDNHRYRVPACAEHAAMYGARLTPAGPRPRKAVHDERQRPGSTR